MDWLSFHHPTDNFLPFVRQLEKIFWTCRRASTLQRTFFGRKTGGAREKYFPLYITNGHFFGLCPEKVLRLERRGLRFCSKRSFHYSTDKINRSVTVLSRGRFPLYFTTDIFPQKLGTLFQKNFFCPWSSLYLAK